MNDVLNRLNERLTDTAPDDYQSWQAAAADAESEGYDPPAWTIEDDDAAAWASRKAAAAHHRLAQIEAWKRREIARIEAVAEAESKEPAHTAEWFTGHLAAYVQRLRAEGAMTKKSMTLPGGKIAIRHRKPVITWDGSDDDVIANLRAAGVDDVVRVRESIDRRAFDKAVTIEGGMVILTATGEVLDGVRAEPVPESVTFTPTDDAS